jgi:hypothetical protein
MSQGSDNKEGQIMLRQGSGLRFDYPEANHQGLPPVLHKRRVIVEDVRDTQEKPLDPITIEVRPKLKRGRYLVVGYDIDKKAVRRFYLDSMVDITPFTLATLRLGIYDQLSDAPPELLGTTYVEHEEQGTLLHELDVLNEWLASEGNGLVAGIFPAGVA